jgi:hypothetical protein
MQVVVGRQPQLGHDDDRRIRVLVDRQFGTHRNMVAAAEGLAVQADDARQDHPVSGGIAGEFAP